MWKTKEGIMKTSGIVDRGEDTIRNFEKVEQEEALTPPYLQKEKAKRNSFADGCIA